METGRTADRRYEARLAVARADLGALAATAGVDLEGRLTMDKQPRYDAGPYDDEQQAAAQFDETALGIPGRSATAAVTVLMDAVQRARLTLTPYEEAALASVAMDEAARPAVAQILAGLIVRAAHPDNTEEAGRARAVRTRRTPPPYRER